MFEFIKKHQFLFVLCLSLIVSFALFGNAIKGDFVFDDNAVVKNRGDLKDISNIFNLFVSPYHQNMPLTGLYRPFTMATYALNHAIFGTEPKNFHVTNIIIHAINSFLVFWFVSYFLKSSKLAYLSFALFLIHPLHTEAVTWIVGRAELLAFMWGLIAIYFYLKKDRILSSVAFLLALWSKESAVVLLPLVVYLDYNFQDTPPMKAILRASYLLGAIGVYSIFRYWTLGSHFFGDATTTIVENQIKFLGFGAKIATALKVFFMYLVKLIWPAHLSADYSYNTIQNVSNIFTSPQSLIGCLVLAGLIYLAVSRKTRKTAVGLGAITFLIPYLMISNLIFSIGTVMGERLMYFSSLGFVIIIAFLINRLLESSRNFRYAGYAIIILIVSLFSARIVIRNRDWKDTPTLFYATLKEAPNSLITRTAIAGIDIRNNKWADAKEQLEIAKNIYADNSHLQNLLGVVAENDGELREAEERYKRSIELNSEAIDSYINLGELLIKNGRFQEAAPYFLKVINFYPVPEYVIRYCYIQIALNQPDEALNTMSKYFGDNLNHPDLSAVVGTAYFVKQDYNNALVYLNNAKKLGNRSKEVQQMIDIASSKFKN